MNRIIKSKVVWLRCFHLTVLATFFLITFFFPHTVQAALNYIDGTSSLQWESTTETFDTDGSGAVGFVKFKDGFQITNKSWATFNITESVEGNINMGTTTPGTMRLKGPISFAPGVTFDNGGIIEGNGYTIIFEGDVTIPEGKTFHITSTTAIDGCGNTLYLEPHANISLDNNVTLTLRNMRVKNTRNSSSNPIIRPSGHRAQVSLQDVELALADDFIFRDGQLFIHDDVIVTGSSVFSYRSTQTSYICDAATFAFDKDSTFLYYPSIMDNHLIQMQSDTSTLYLDGATLQATHTGMRLSNGRVCFDNNVVLNSSAQTRLNIDFNNPVFNYDLGGAFVGLTWSPDGRFLAGSLNGGRVRVYPDYNINTGIDSYLFNRNGPPGNPRWLEWTPNSRFFMAVYDDGTLKVFEKNNVLSGTTTAFYNQDLSTNSFYALAISPCGQYIALGDDNAGGLMQVITWDTIRENQTTTIFSRTLGSAIRCIKWSPDGNYIAVGLLSGYLEVYSLTQHILLDTIASPIYRQTVGGDIGELNWSPDGNYLALGASNGDVKVLTLAQVKNNASGVYLFSADIGGAARINALHWNPDGRYIALGQSDNRVKILGLHANILASNTTPLFNYLNTYQVWEVKWSPDGAYLAIGDNSGLLKVFPTNYTTETASQVFTTGVIFGDSSQASGAGNLDVKILGGAQVSIDGYVMYDNES